MYVWFSKNITITILVHPPSCNARAKAYRYTFAQQPHYRVVPNIANLPLRYSTADSPTADDFIWDGEKVYLLSLAVYVCPTYRTVVRICGYAVTHTLLGYIALPSPPFPFSFSSSIPKSKNYFQNPNSIFERSAASTIKILTIKQLNSSFSSPSLSSFRKWVFMLYSLYCHLQGMSSTPQNQKANFKLATISSSNSKNPSCFHLNQHHYSALTLTPPKEKCPLSNPSCTLCKKSSAEAQQKKLVKKSCHVSQSALRRRKS